MRILRVHNQYQQRGGEDVVFESEVQLLRNRGVEVETLVVSNDQIASSQAPLHALKVAVGTVWSSWGHRLVKEAVRRSRPDVVHFDNTFPLISPSAYSAAHQHGAAVVQTLHNYRLICPKATFFRDGKVCEDCIGKLIPYPSVVHACYRDSHLQSADVMAMLFANRVLGTWTRNVDLYITLSHFAKDKMVEGGLPGDKIRVKPNSVDRPEVPQNYKRSGLLFVGRLVEEKGINILVRSQGYHRVPLRIIGDGPLRSLVDEASRKFPEVTVDGPTSKEVVKDAMVRASALLFPSVWYEGFPMTIVEAMASGLPIIASRIGTLAEVVRVGHTGLLFDPGNPKDLAEKALWAMSHTDELNTMGLNARAKFESEYTSDHNFQSLMDIYKESIELSKKRR